MCAGSLGLTGWRLSLGGRRQLEVERGAAPDVARIANHAAVGIDDAVAYRQTEAGALPHWLRRKEGLEELRLVLDSHARPVVLHFDADLPAGFEEPDQDAALAAIGSLDR